VVEGVSRGGQRYQLIAPLGSHDPSNAIFSNRPPDRPAGSSYAIFSLHPAVVGITGGGLVGFISFFVAGMLRIPSAGGWQVLGRFMGGLFGGTLMGHLEGRVIAYSCVKRFLWDIGCNRWSQLPLTTRKTAFVSTIILNGAVAGVAWMTKDW
jgi:hypothetical protein